MLKNKKGFVTSPIDLMKGLAVGFIIGAVLVFLMAKGILNWWDICGVAQ